MTELTEKDLADVEERLDYVSGLEWMKRFAPDEMQALVYQDVPKLVAAVREHLKGADNDSPRKADKRPRSKTGRRSANRT